MDDERKETTKANEPPKTASSAGPVMDVVPPPATSPEPDSAPYNDKSHQPPLAESTPSTKAATEKSELRPDKPAPPSQPPKPIIPKQRSSGVDLVIFATVIIVLGLAALAVYAYLKSR